MRDLPNKFWFFLSRRKRYWLLPLVVVFLLLALLALLSDRATVIPLIYSL